MYTTYAGGIHTDTVRKEVFIETVYVESANLIVNATCKIKNSQKAESHIAQHTQKIAVEKW